MSIFAQSWEAADEPATGDISIAPPEELSVDVLVVGGGVGGLMAAYRARTEGARVALLSGSSGASDRISSMNTALGYDADDSPAALFDDMYRAGGYVNDPSVAAALARRIGPEVLELERLGVPFHRAGEHLARRQAAGSTSTRAVYTLGLVGVDVARTLLQVLSASEGNFVRLAGAKAVDLLRDDDGRAAGALVYSPRERRWLVVHSAAVVLATGGAGQLFARTTNPRGSVGTGQAMALEMGAQLADMEFVSFEPFVTSRDTGAAWHDLPTTVLREGARIRNGLGQEFLDLGSPLTKDIICRAMVREVMEGRGTPTGGVLYDIREMDPEVVDRYVQVKEALRSYGVSASAAQFEVSPAQHFLMGGVKIDSTGATTVPGLFAVGEVAAGAHGAHRLAAGGGMEVVAGGAIAGQNAARCGLDAGPGASVAPASPRPAVLAAPQSARSERLMTRIRTALDHGCGILRTGAALTETVAELSEIQSELTGADEDTFLLRGTRVAMAVAESARLREESRGDHWRVDFPQRDDVEWLCNLVATLDDDGNVSVRPTARA
ncbi:MULTISPECIES: FAD-binding protein [unclassified Nocardioides]|uniref:FAD-binding protein n=1 Tax=unclassified Nocardioides TaxID=2615069 RepID=UPI000A26EDC9|nr:MULTISPECIES: FAD-binding protein [unclassified Nocardioides]